MMFTAMLCLAANALAVSVVDTKTFTVSAGHTDQFYGKDWSVKTAGDGSQYLSLDYANKNSSATSNIRGLAYGIELTQAGSYTISFDSLISDYDSQFGFWQVYLADNGAKLPLDGGPKWSTEYSKTDLLDKGAVPENGGNWYSTEITITISQEQLDEWDQMIFTYSASRQTSQAAGIRNFSMGVTPNPPGGVPEPLTVLSIFAATGGLGMYVRKRVK